MTASTVWGVNVGYRDDVSVVDDVGRVVVGDGVDDVGSDCSNSRRSCRSCKSVSRAVNSDAGNARVDPPRLTWSVRPVSARSWLCDATGVVGVVSVVVDDEDGVDDVGSACSNGVMNNDSIEAVVVSSSISLFLYCRKIVRSRIKFAFSMPDADPVVVVPVVSVPA